MSEQLPPCDHDECGPTHCLREQVAMSKAFAQQLLEELYELRGERDWWKDEPRPKYQKGWRELCDLITSLKSKIEHPFVQHYCHTCKEPMSNDCPNCQKAWES